MSSEENDTQKKLDWMKTRNKNQKKLDELASAKEEPYKEASASEQCAATLQILEDMGKSAFVAGQQITPMPTAPGGEPLPPEMMDPAVAGGMPPGGIPPMDPSMMPPPAAPPMDPGMAPPMDPGMAPPMDPNMMPMVDPATGLPIDPTTGMPMDPTMGGMVDPAAAGMTPEGEEGEAPVAEERIDSLEKQVGELTDIVATMQDESGSAAPAPSAEPAAGEEGAVAAPAGAPLTGASTREALGKLRTGQASNNPDTLARVMGSMQGA